MPRNGVVCGGGGSSIVSTRQANYFDIKDQRGNSREIAQAISKYTTNDVYAEVNSALCKDDGYLLQRHGKFINLLRQGLYGRSESGTVYRGMFLPGSDHELYTLGRKFLWPGFTSTSRDPEQAYAFGSWAGYGEKVMFQIELSLGRGITYCRDISDFSHYPSEQEVLFFCYSGFEVIGRERIHGSLHITLKPYDTKEVEALCHRPSDLTGHGHGWYYSSNSSPGSPTSSDSSDSSLFWSD